MHLRDSIEKTKLVLNKTLQNLKSLFLGGYHKLPKPAFLNLLSSCSSCSFKNHRTEKYYTDFCNEWEFDLETEMKRKKSGILTPKEALREEEEEQKEECNASSMKLPKSPLKNKEDEEIIKEEKSKKMSQSRKVEEEYSKKKDKGGYALAKKMKELEMMDVSDVEHVLDVEEALHYYNRLKSPVYQDIVDQFFTDMYREFSVPQASASINSSKRRLGSIRL